MNDESPQVFLMYRYIRIERPSTGSRMLLKLPFPMNSIMAAMWFMREEGMGPSWEVVTGYSEKP